MTEGRETPSLIYGAGRNLVDTPCHDSPLKTEQRRGGRSLIVRPLWSDPVASVFPRLAAHVDHIPLWGSLEGEKAAQGGN